MSLKYKIFMVFAVIFMIGAAGSLFSLMNSLKLNQELDGAFAKPLTAVEAARAAWIDFRHIHDHLTRVVSMTSPIDSGDSLREFRVRIEHFEKQLEKLAASTVSERSRASMAKIEKASGDWRRYAQTLLGARPATSVPAPHIMSELEQDISLELDRLVNATLADAAGLRTSIGARLHSEVLVSAAALVLSLVMGSILAAVAGIYIVNPLVRLQTTMKAIANYEVETEIDDTERSDEIGAMAKALEVFRENALERARIEGDLRTSEERFKDLAEAGSDWIWECDAELRFTYLSEGYYRLAGVEPDQILGKTRHDLGRGAEADWQAHLKDLDERRPFRDFRYSRPNAEGELIYFSTNGSPIFAEDGSFTGYRGTGSERTAAERKDAMVNLMSTISYAANESANADQALEVCLTLICKFNDWKIGHVYAAASAGSKKLLPGRAWYLADPPRYKDFKLATELSVLDASTGASGEAFSKGESYWKADFRSEENFERATVGASVGLIGAAAFPIMVGDEPVAVLEFLTDEELNIDNELKELLAYICAQISRVMEREQNQRSLQDQRDRLQDMVEEATLDLKDKAEELRKSLDNEQKVNAQQRQFVLMASHEFRTPLAIIDSTAQRLQRKVSKSGVTPEHAIERTDRIMGAVQRMTRLIDSTLSAFRMQEGNLKIAIGRCDIAGLIEEVCERQQDITASHVITRQYDGLPKTISADTNALELVLSNLLSNAVKYAPGAPEIDVTAKLDGDHVEVTVRDRGIGIDKDDVPKIGERFFRAKTASGIAGTGIGLNMAKSLIDLHDGSFRCKSVKGGGTSFTLRLPVAGPKKKSERAA